MTELYLEDFFAANGGAANDATSCSAALQAAMNALYASHGGTIVFPEGICSLTAESTKNFAGKEGTVKFKGTGGNSAVRFNNGGSIRVDSTDTVIVEDLTFLGKTVAGWSTVLNYFLFSGTTQSIWNRCNFYGLATNTTTANGNIYDLSRHSVFRECGFYGCMAGRAGVINLFPANAVVMENLVFHDYGTFNNVLYSRIADTGNASAWIYGVHYAYNNPLTRFPMITIRDAMFDEGAGSPVVIENYLSATVENIHHNLGAGFAGMSFKKLVHLTVKDSWIGYGGTDYAAVIADDVRLVDLESITLANGPHHFELLGDTQKLRMNNCRWHDYANDTFYDDIDITNTAGAIIERDGVVTKGDIVQIGA